MNFLGSDQAKLMSRLTKREQLEAELMRDGYTIQAEYKNHILISCKDRVDSDRVKIDHIIILPNHTRYAVQGFSYEAMSARVFKAFVYALNFNIETGAYNPQVIAGNDG